MFEFDPKGATTSARTSRAPSRFVVESKGGGARRAYTSAPSATPQDAGSTWTLPRAESATAKPISICGKSFIADASGALYWPAKRTLLVADLHLEKGSAWAARGTLLPPYDTCQTLIRLAEAIDRYEPACVIALGDSFHNAGATARLGRDDLEALHLLQEGRDWIWITGNHDPEIAARVGGRVCGALDIGGLTLRHEPAAGTVTHEIAGHMHPAARLTMHGYSVRRPCFVGNGRRLVLPAFGAFTGGLNVLDDAFEPLFGSGGLAVWMLGQTGLYPVAPRFLSGD